MSGRVYYASKHRVIKEPLSTVRIDTAQNVAIDYEIASVGDRVTAALLDGAIIFAAYMVAFALVGLVELQNPGTDWAIFVFLVPLLLYHLLSETFLNGQSIGKRIMKVRVVRLDGTPAGFGAYLMRWLLRIVEITICYGSIALVTIVINGRGQRLGDMAAGTCVVKVKKRTRLSDTIYANVADDAEPTFPEVARLDDADVAVARDVLAAVRDARRSPAIKRLAENAAAGISTKMGVTVDGSAVRFLRTVVDDYNRVSRRTSWDPDAR